MILTNLPSKYQKIYYDLDVDSAAVSYGVFYALETLKDKGRFKCPYWKEERDEFKKINKLSTLIACIKYKELTHLINIDDLLNFVILKCQ